MEEQVTNHSDVIETPIESTNTEAAPTEVTTPPVEQPKGITVKYNKEEKFVTEDEIPQWVQKGLNYDKVSERAKQAENYQQSLDRIAKFYGYESHDDYMKALDEAETQRQIEAEARRLGVDPSVIQEYVQPMKTEVQTLKQQLEQYKNAEIMKMIEAEEADIRKDDPGYDQIKDQVHGLAMQRGLKVSEAYILLTHSKKVEQAKLQAEQEAITKLKQNADTSTGALGADAPEEKTGYLNMTPAERRAFRERVKRGEVVI
ncbi:hypothetical protein [Paenibacillus sp. HJGM_3]|uniref:hypothetical protein n=1 Tax=Paenibacillus sp. HJGM_3 TaxID=3379816 RepID=UPI003859CC71